MFGSAKNEGKDDTKSGFGGMFGSMDKNDKEDKKETSGFSLFDNKPESDKSKQVEDEKPSFGGFNWNTNKSADS